VAQTRSLQIGIDAIGDFGPECAISSNECLYFTGRQFDALIAEREKKRAWTFEESESILLVGDQSADDQLNRFLGHVALAQSATPVSPSDLPAFVFGHADVVRAQWQQ
jgi:hypothetical protein